MPERAAAQAQVAAEKQADATHKMHDLQKENIGATNKATEAIHHLEGTQRSSTGQLAEELREQRPLAGERSDRGGPGEGERRRRRAPSNT